MWASFWWWCIIFISLGSFFRSWLRELSPKSSVPSGGGIMRQPGQAGQSFTFIINVLSLSPPLILAPPYGLRFATHHTATPPHRHNTVEG